MPKRAFVLLILGFAVFAAFVGLRLLSVLYTDYLWFSSLDFHDVFITIIRTKTLALFAFGSVFALICGMSIVAARRYGQPTRIMALEVIIDAMFPHRPTTLFDSVTPGSGLSRCCPFLWVLRALRPGLLF